MDIILNIEADINIHKKLTAEWVKYAIGTFRVDTINEAIRRLVASEQFLFIEINEDSIPHFMSQLPILSDTTALPIFITSSSFTLQKHMEALDLGADSYERRFRRVSENILLHLKKFKALERRAHRPVNLLPLLIGGDLILSQPRRKVFVKDTEIILAQQEFDILRYLLKKRGTYVSYDELLSAIWNGRSDYVSHSTLWKAIKRLRQRLSVFPDSPEYILNERNIGYIFP